MVLTEFKIKVIKENRVLLSICIVSIILPFCVLVAASNDLIFFKVLIPLFVLGITASVLYYYSVGHLAIILSERKLVFNWETKPIFNFKRYEDILVDDITHVILEEGTYLRKLKTNYNEIELGGIKSRKSDSIKLLEYLKTEGSIEIIDSWDKLKKQGWLDILFKVNLFLLILAINFIIVYVFIKGFNSKIILFLPLVLSQLILAHIKMKEKLK